MPRVQQSTTAICLDILVYLPVEEFQIVRILIVRITDPEAKDLTPFLGRVQPLQPAQPDRPARTRRFHQTTRIKPL
ncbi:hypothetical protein S7S_15070 [Isoalcanivorax pacificus W11-5]|uniref:Uncharacterized protein n=1 Tax=Isoalcanivorax pacificus W11-5 TaxID=391936 RepID=A0A0B4XQF1_9GAMM|nr:hypothetical protein S7S_15070 [Isoalcanivorax pacificus W11-5]